jgi:hypothetical protein
VFDVAALPIKGKSGDVNLDLALVAELGRIKGIIPVNPGFQYIEENSPNAYAISETLIPGTKGTVLLGLKLVSFFMKSQNGGASVAGVCAHECGHIYQYFSSYAERFATDNNGRILRELHADFIAGYYMGRRKEYTANHVKLFSRTLFDVGTYDFANPQYHGSPALRATSMEAGYHQAATGVTFADATAKGEAYVRCIAGPIWYRLIQSQGQGVCMLSILSSTANAQQLPDPPSITNPTSGSNIAGFFSTRTPYEFWLTCVIGLTGLLIMGLLIWSMRRSEHIRPEDISRPIIVITVIIGTLILVTAGYSNEQIAPAFGLFGTIIGYMLGRLAQRPSTASTKTDGVTNGEHQS